MAHLTRNLIVLTMTLGLPAGVMIGFLMAGKFLALLLLPWAVGSIIWWFVLRNNELIED